LFSGRRRHTKSKRDWRSDVWLFRSDDTDLIAVVLAEQRHRSHRLGLLQRGLDGVDLVVGVNCRVRDFLDLLQLLLGQLIAIGEVEAQVAWLVHGTGLYGCRTQYLAQGGVDQ